MPTWNDALPDAVTGDYVNSRLLLRVAGTPDQAKEMPLLTAFGEACRRATDGTAAAPGQSFLADATAGMYRTAGGSLGLSVAGVSRLLIDSTGLAAFSGALTAGGLLTAPTLSIAGAATIGGATSVTGNLTVSGTSSVTGQQFGALGSVTQPSYSFTGDTNTGMWSPSPDAIVFSTGGNERIRINASGLVGVGISPATAFHVRSAAADAMQNIARFDAVNVAGDDYAGLFIAGDPINNIIQMSATGTNPASFVFFNGVTEALRIENAVGTRPGTDNNRSLGTAAFRWSQVFAGTGTINTSDEREKVWRGGLTPAERAAALEIVAELGFYRWTEAVATKNGSSRLHFGARAQRVWGIMANHGLVDPIGPDGRPGATPYAFLCYDEWPDYFEDVAPDPDADGIIAPDAEPVRRLARASGNRYGLRIDQLTLFLIAAAFPAA